jgi:anti-sigma-K factor RskA
MTGTDIHTLAGPFAVDAVSDIERAEFARHLAVCESCQQETAELAETVARLAGATALTPPSRLKAAVLAAAAQTRQVPPQVRPSRTGSATSRRGWRGWMAAAAAAVVIAITAGAVGFAISNQRVRTEQSRAAAAEAQNARMTRIVSAPDARSHIERLPAGGQVTVIVSPSLNEGVAVLADMPALGAGQFYELWLIHGDKPVPAGTMDPGTVTGTAFLTGVSGANAFGVSAEHATGATQPATPLVTSFGLTTT